MTDPRSILARAHFFAPACFFNHTSKGVQTDASSPRHAEMLFAVHTSTAYTGWISHTDCRFGPSAFPSRQGRCSASNSNCPVNRSGTLGLLTFEAVQTAGL